MACISAPTAALVGGGISGIGSIFGGISGSNAATSAAKVQADAAKMAAGLQYNEFQKIQENLNPFITGGIGAYDTLLGLTGGNNPAAGYLTSDVGTTSPISTSFAPTEASLAATPGYQFNLAQGTKAAQNQLASQGLGKSGAAAVAAGKYASGLADTTYQSQFSNWYNQQQLGLQNWLSEKNLALAQRQQVYNMIGGLATTGENAAAMSGTQGIQSAAQVGNSLTSGAAATAGGIVGSANALNQGFAGVGGAASNTALMLALNNSGMYGTRAPSSNSMSPETTALMLSEGFGGS